MTGAAARRAIGAQPLGDGTTVFRVWAPRAARVAVELVAHGRYSCLEPRARGWFEGVAAVGHGDRYAFVLDDRTRLPDPASRWQPDGVQGHSAVFDPGRYVWRDAHWSGRALTDYVIQELHVGTFTAAGTLDAAAARLPALADLGITAIELMPIGQFPGTRNWGYDGVFPFSVQASYGGPAALQRFVDAAHDAGIAVVLDVVFNHLGPEGNRLREFGPYFTDRYRTPWGDALDFDGAGSDEVRAFFIAAALQWVRDFHIDALRLDAIHAIHDESARPFLAELAEAVHATGLELGRQVLLIAESDRGDPRILGPELASGLGMDATWMDDFHHALHVALTGESQAYYADFTGPHALPAALRGALVYAGQYACSRGRRHGAPPTGVPPERFVVFAQNHDQIGNRRDGDRLAALVPPDRQRLALAAVLLSPFTPLLFMGEEYGETAPFPYFVSHEDVALVEAVRRGRHEEFAAFGWRGAPPDPQAEATFRSAIIDAGRAAQPPHDRILACTRELLRLRATLGPVRRFDTIGVRRIGPAIELLRARGGSALLLLMLPSADAASLAVAHAGTWQPVFDSADVRWGGPGSLVRDAVAAGRNVRIQPWSLILLARRN